MGILEPREFRICDSHATIVASITDGHSSDFESRAVIHSPRLLAQGSRFGVKSRCDSRDLIIFLSDTDIAFAIGYRHRHNILASMSSLMQSRWADPEPPATTEEKKQPEPETKPAPELEQPAPETTSERPESRRKSEHTLSAAATSFAPSSPAAPPPDLSTYDEFTQTGGGDGDLFDDMIPVEESMQTRPPDDLFGDDFTPVEQPVAEKQAIEHTAVEEAPAEQPTQQPAPQAAPQPQQQQARGKGDGARGRGRGRGRGGRKEPLGQQSQGQAKPEPKSEETQTPVQAPDNAPTGPKKETTASVRGDRRGTGGVRKPKLTETELAEKMAQISIKNASLTAAHARAEADAASFAEREQEAKAQSAQRAKEERRDRQQMMGERERNRLRKLKALEGREWDMEKNEDDFSKGGKYDKKGGFSGDKEDYTDGREYLLRDAKEKRGGGSRSDARGGKQAQHTAPPKKEDFPSLPPKKDGEAAAPKKETDTSFFDNAATKGKSWADQVESTTPTG